MSGLANFLFIVCPSSINAPVKHAVGSQPEICAECNRYINQQMRALPPNSENLTPPQGISRRAFFAGMALQGLLAQGDHMNRNISEPWAEYCVRSSWEYADRMIEAFEEEGNK